jgi:hypothetical protein
MPTADLTPFTIGPRMNSRFKFDHISFVHPIIRPVVETRTLATLMNLWNIDLLAERQHQMPSCIHQQPVSFSFDYTQMPQPQCHPSLSTTARVANYPWVNLNTKLTMTAQNSAIVKTVGPNRSSKPPCPRIRMLLARQWNVYKAYTIAAMATNVNRPALIFPILSPKLRRPMASPPRITVKLSHERKVRSLAKKTLGSTRVGSAMRLPGRRC